jgi:orotate phosphoribosyltransferase
VRVYKHSAPTERAITVNAPTAASFFELTSARRGHFQLESGYHGELWLDLDALFADSKRIAPFVEQLAESLRPYKVEAICGPLLGGAFLAQLVAQSLSCEFCFTERVMPANANGLYPASYRLPPAFSTRVRGKRVAIVDDIVSAGSALRGTYTQLQTHGAKTAVAGALMVFGNTGADFFATVQVPVAAVVRESYALWLPSDCPLCNAGMPLENVSDQVKE